MKTQHFTTLKITAVVCYSFTMDEKSGDSKNMSPLNNHDPSEKTNSNVDENDLQGKFLKSTGLQKVLVNKNLYIPQNWLKLTTALMS